MMKRIDHIALTVPDVEEATRFFEQAFTNCFTSEMFFVGLIIVSLFPKAQTFMRSRSTFPRFRIR